MKLTVKKATSKELHLLYQRGYNRVLAVLLVAFFLAGLIYWFVFVPSNEASWYHQGPLMKKEGAEVLFRMPNHEQQENFYVPLNEPFISHKEKRERFELMLHGRTSMKWKVDRIYERKVGTYSTREDALVHYNEIIDFLKSDRKILEELSVLPNPKAETQQGFAYLPFLIALLISLYFVLIPVVNVQIMMNRTSQEIILIRGSVLLPKKKIFSLADFESAQLNKHVKGNSKVYELHLNIKDRGDFLVWEYRPPYKDDKLIASLSQYTRLINWWNDDELIEKYGDDILNNTQSS